MAKPKYITISAKPGNPSILWIGKSGRYYRNIVAALTDKAENAFEYSKTTVNAPAEVNTNQFIMLSVIVIVVALIAYKIIA